MRRENILSSNGYVYGYVIPNIPYTPYTPLLRKPVSYEPALNVASACHRDESGEFFFFPCMYPIPKQKRRKKRDSPEGILYKKPKVYTPRYAIPGINRSVAQSLL